MHIYQIALTKLLHIDLPVSVDYFRKEILADVIAEKTVIDIAALTETILKRYNE